MEKRIAIARIISVVPADRRAEFLRAMRGTGLLSDSTLDRSYRGEGNAALRRQGVVRSQSCECVTCVVYGGDCSYQMWREDHTRWHREQRGVKTRGQ